MHDAAKVLAGTVDLRPTAGHKDSAAHRFDLRADTTTIIFSKIGEILEMTH